MPEVVVSYSSPKTLKVLKVLSELLDFKLLKSEKVQEPKLESKYIIPGDKSIDISDMSEIITRNNMDAKKLRKEAWGRNK